MFWLAVSFIHLPPLFKCFYLDDNKFKGWITDGQLFSGVNINIGIFEKLFVFLTDQLGSLPTYSLSTGHLCSSYICWEGLPRTVDSFRDYKHVFWTSQSDGKVWPTSRQIHGLLSAVPWWCSTQGCECSYCDHQDQENHSVCGLVPNWLQGLLSP